jgi:AcrR family transcriptional regulator
MSTQKRKYELKARAESQRQTRERIVQATMDLHMEVGPAQTTVAEIARRAGVQRLTVYNHFPEEVGLFAACQGHWMAQNPLPDLSGALGLTDPTARVRGVLELIYGYWERTAAMTEHVQRDRHSLPALDAQMRETADVMVAGLVDELAGGFGRRGRRAARVHALTALAFDFWTWRRLSGEGLGAADAARLMADGVASA